MARAEPIPSGSHGVSGSEASFRPAWSGAKHPGPYANVCPHGVIFGTNRGGSKGLSTRIRASRADPLSGMKKPGAKPGFRTTMPMPARATARPARRRIVRQGAEIGQDVGPLAGFRSPAKAMMVPGTKAFGFVMNGSCPRRPVASLALHRGGVVEALVRALGTADHAIEVGADLVGPALFEVVAGCRISSPRSGPWPDRALARRTGRGSAGAAAGAAPPRGRFGDGRS